VTPPNFIEDHFDWHNTFNGQYSMGDISYVRYISVNNGHSMYWKTSKNFADGVSHHVIDSIFANDPKDSIGQLQVYGPSGPFTFKFTNNSFLGGPVGTAALCAGQHCGLGGAGGPCNVQYLLEGVNWSGLMRSQKRIQFGVNTASFGQVQPIFLAKDNSLGGFRSMVSQYLNGFAKVGCTQQDSSWDSGYACYQPIRRLNFWVFADQGNLTLSGPGYDNVDINYAYPVLGLNAGVMQMEPMHKGYGLPVLAGGSYTISSQGWRGGVAVEFSDPEVAEYFGVTDHLSLKVVNGTTCNLSSGDPRNFLNPLGLNGQASTMSLEGRLKCFIQGEVLPDLGVGGSSGGGSSGGGAGDHTGVPTGRVNGTCQWDNVPNTGFEWDPWCFYGGLGCLADGRNIECRFCGSAPFNDCTATTTPITTSTSTTTIAPVVTQTTTSPAKNTTTTTASPLVVAPGGVIRSNIGACLTARQAAQDGGPIEARPCTSGAEDQIWHFDGILLRSQICLDSQNSAKVNMWACRGGAAQTWSVDVNKGKILHSSGVCLEASSHAVALGQQCLEPLPGSECYKATQWAKDFGINEHPEWYPGLSPTSTWSNFQAFLASKGYGSCSQPCFYEVVVAPCDDARPSQVWAIGTAVVQPTSTTTTTTAGSTAAATTTTRATVIVTTTTLATSTVELTTTATTTAQAPAVVLGSVIRSNIGTCLTAPQAAQDGGSIQARACISGAVDQSWHFDGVLRNQICLDSPLPDLVHMWTCKSGTAQRWQLDVQTGKISHSSGLCLEAPSQDLAVGEQCHDPLPDSKCYIDTRWATNVGIFAHPEWYPGLNASSTWSDFQGFLASKNLSGCGQPCKLEVRVAPCDAAQPKQVWSIGATVVATTTSAAVAAHTVQGFEQDASSSALLEEGQQLLPTEADDGLRPRKVLGQRAPQSLTK